MADRNVLVINDDTNVYQEKWMDYDISIPPGKAVRMVRADALKLLGTYQGDPANPGKPKIKMLRMVPLGTAPVVMTIGPQVQDTRPKPFVSNFDGKRFDTQQELNAHLKTIGHLTVDPDETAKTAPQDPDGEVTCPFCQKTGLKGATGLQSHMRFCEAMKKKTGDDNDSD